MDAPSRSPTQPNSAIEVIRGDDSELIGLTNITSRLGRSILMTRAMHPGYSGTPTWRCDGGWIETSMVENLRRGSSRQCASLEHCWCRRGELSKHISRRRGRSKAHM